MRSFKPNFFNRNNNGQTLKLTPLGGVGDVTKNMYVYEFGNDIIIVDCGVGFPDEATMPGVDLVIPDINYLKDKKDKIRGILITHGHDDHIGGLPFIWPELRVPIYTQKLTAGFIKSKFTEHKLPKDKIHELNFESKINLGVFNISCYVVSHSIPDSMGIVIDTPVGRIIHQADFKIDWTPVSGQVTDVNKIAQISAKGVKLLLIDCLRVEKPGFNKSEKSIEETFEKASLETTGKLLITMTSSNISRMQQAINVAARTGRKLALAGRSFENCFQVARDLNYLDVPPGIVVPLDAGNSFKQKLLILIAGSQGQEGSALSRAANGVHKQIKLQEGDGVVFSADPIPSTEAAQSTLIDVLTKSGVEVYYSAIQSDLHVSGHAAVEELRVMVNLIKPEYILPIGGSYRHMKAFARMAYDLGYGKDKILNEVIDGDSLLISKEGIKLGDNVEVRNVFVDGLGIGDIGSVVLRDRQVMSEEGVVVVVVPIDQHTGKLAGDVDIISRGFVFENEASNLIGESRQLVLKQLQTQERRISDWRFIRKLIEDTLTSYLYKATERRPLILPVVVEV